MVGQLIGVATMRVGLTVNAKLDKTQYPINFEVTEEDVASVNLGSHALYGEWTYAIRPTRCICRPWTAQAVLVSLFPPTRSCLIGRPL
jgi:hypothetical protein